MKRYAIPVVVLFAVLALTLSAFVQAQDRANQGQSMRERFANMSEEEKAQARARMQARGGGFSRLSSEDQQKAIKAIEEQLVKLKAVAQIQRPQGGFQDMSEEERNKMMTAYRDRRTALQTIVAQVALLEGRSQPEGEDARFIIINTADLKPIQEAATKEKAEETGKLLQGLMARGSGRGFRGRGAGSTGAAGTRPEGGQRRQRQQ